MNEMVGFKKVDTDDLVKSLDEFDQKLYLVAAVIFTLTDVKGESESKQQQHHFLDSGWSSYSGIISFLKTIVECYHMEYSLSPMRPVCYIMPTTDFFSYLIIYWL